MESHSNRTLDIPKWSALLVEAVNKPGLLMEAYGAFWNYPHAFLFDAGGPKTVRKFLKAPLFASIAGGMQVQDYRPHLCRQAFGNNVLDVAPWVSYAIDRWTR